MKHIIRLLTLAFVLTQTVPAYPQSTASEFMAEANKLFQSGDRIGSERLIQTAIEKAVQEKNTQIEADARRILGDSLSRRGQYESAATNLNAAVHLYEQLNNVFRAASVRTSLGQNAWAMGNQTEARRYYEEAMAGFVSINDRSAIAKTHYSLAFLSNDSDKTDRIRSGLAVAREVGDRSLEALFLHLWGDVAYTVDGFDIALERLNQARAIMESLGPGERLNLARVLTSIGRLYRIHGHPEEAIAFYQRARQLQAEVSDTQGVVQSLDSVGVALNQLGRHSEAIPIYEEAQRLAKETNSPLLIGFINDGLASTYLDLRQYQKSLDLLEQSRAMPSFNNARFPLLALARLKLGQYPSALQAADDGLAASVSEEQSRSLHSTKAQVLSRMGKTSEALSEIRMVTESIDKARRTLVPSDFMKQGFADTDRETTTLAIDILLDSNQPRQALASAEQSRSRAFLDLLAAKGLTPNASAGSPSLMPGRSDLASPATAPAASDQDLVAQASRLHATILAYWVGEDSTTIWTVSPSGNITVARFDSGETSLSSWIDDTLRPAAPAASSRSQSVSLPSRAGDTILTSRANQAAWKRLYNSLIRPVRANLPKTGGRLLIIPSGPLFRLSFAALMDEKGRYLIEDYALEYAPSAGVLNYTLQTKQKLQDSTGRYVFVSNPSGMPPLDSGKLLPALPGSDDEVRRITRLFAGTDTVSLRAATANEANVRREMESAKVIHLATHGIVSNDDPFASYLALGHGVSDGDGRLSAGEIYGLKLHADLVTLSACRSGLGKISGDGVAGLARAFFYAGAASVLATLWDVADAPTSELIADFYQSLGPGLKLDKSAALRNAQLRILRALRKGELRVDTPFGRLPLPEDPMLWAGFVLMGEP